MGLLIETSHGQTLQEQKLQTLPTTEKGDRWEDWEIPPGTEQGLTAVPGQRAPQNSEFCLVQKDLRKHYWCNKPNF